jgi:hypothetical protein
MQNLLTRLSFGRFVFVFFSPHSESSVFLGGGRRRNASEAGQDRAAPTGRRDKKIAGLGSGC